jgi:cobalt-zinc-cadmium efflux system outer membrane protein
MYRRRFYGMCILSCILAVLGGGFVCAQTMPPNQIEAIPSPCPQKLECYTKLMSNMRPPELPAPCQPFLCEGAQNQVLSLARLEQIALERNPTLAQAAMQIQAAWGQHEQVGLYPNPVAGYIGEEMGTGGTAGMQGAFISQEIVTAGKLRLNRDVASYEIRQAEWAWQMQRYKIINGVRSAYYEVLYAQQTIAIDEQLFGIGEENVKTAEKMFAAKEVSLVDVLQSRVEADTAQISLQNARNRHQSAWRQLAAVVGLGDMPQAVLAGRLEDGLPQLDWCVVWGRLLGESPQLAKARAGVQAAQAEVARQYAQRVPNVDLRATAQYNNEIGQNISTVEVGLPLPIYNRNQGNIAKAESNLIAAQNEVRRVELELRRQLAAVFEQYLNAMQQAQKYSGQILPNSAKTLELVRSGYQLGEFNYQALLITQRTYFQANLAYMENLRQARQSAVAIEGLLLAGGLQSAFDRTGIQ